MRQTMFIFLLINLVLIRRIAGVASWNSSDPDGVVVVSRGISLNLLSVQDTCNFVGAIRLGGPSSLFQRDKYYTLASNQLTAYHMIADYVNRHRCGVKLHDQNYRLELQSYDDSSSVDWTYQVAKYLVNNNGTDIILGGYSSETTEPLANVTSSSGRLLLAPGASTTSVFADRPKTFGTIPPNSQFPVDAVKAMAEVAGARSIATVYEDGSFARGVCGAIPKLAEQYGLSLASQNLVVATPNVSILEPVARNLSKENPDVVMMCTYDGGCQNWMKAMKNVGWSPKAQIFTVCVGLQNFVRTSGSDVTYVFGVTPWDQSLTVVDPITGWSAQDFADIYRVVTNDVDVPYQAASAAAVLSIIVQSIEAVQTLDEAILADYIATSSFKTVYGDVQFDSNGQSKAPSLLIQYDASARVQTVYPSDISSGTLLYPMPNWDQRACVQRSICQDQGNTCNATGQCICQNSNDHPVDSGASAMCIPKENMNYLSPSILGSLYFMLAVNCFLCLSGACWMCYYRSNQLVKASQPICLFFIICGTLLSTLSIIPMSYQTGYEDSPDVQVADIACMAVPWMWGLGFYITFASLFFKIWKVKKSFDSSAGFVKKPVGFNLVYYILFGMGAIEVAILLAFQLVSPLKWQRQILNQVNGYAIVSQGVCTSQNGYWFFLALGGLNILCLLDGMILSFQIKDHPTVFGESKQIFLAVMLMFQVVVLAIPLSALVRNDSTSFCFIRATSVFLQNFTVLVVMFCPKMLTLYRGGEDVAESLRLSMVGQERPLFDGQEMVHRSVPPLTASVDEACFEEEDEE